MFYFQSDENAGDVTPQKKKKSSKEDELLKLAADHLKEANDDGAVLARSWGAQYNKLRTEQQVFAKKIFADVLFYGEMGFLDMNCTRGIQSVLERNSRSSTPSSRSPSASTASTSSHPPTMYYVQPRSIQRQSARSSNILNTNEITYASFQDLFDSVSQDVDIE